MPRSKPSVALRSMLAGTSFPLVFGCLLLLAVTAVADERTQIIQSRPLDTFDDQTATQWAVRGSKFATPGYPQLRYVEASPDALRGRGFSTDNPQALGVRSRFDRRGYNFIELIPVREGPDGLEPNPLPIPGRVQSFDLWVWGANYNYILEIHLRDHHGVDHTLTLGDLKFAGWKQLTVRVPGAIPQQQLQLPRLKGLVLTKLMIWTKPEERVDDFFVYLDELSVLTDVFESRFDGDALVDPAFVSQVWGTE